MSADSGAEGEPGGKPEGEPDANPGGRPGSGPGRNSGGRPSGPEGTGPPRSGGPGGPDAPDGPGGPDAPDGPGGRPSWQEAVDPDVDLHVPAQRAETAGRHGLVVLAVIGAGGALGSLARHALSLWLPARGAAGFPWGIFVVNVSGCVLIGVLMALVAESGRDARAPALLRPFLGVGVLGGFTTFSTYAVDAAHLLRAGPHAAPAAVAYVAGTLLGALAAVGAGAAATRALLEVRRR